MDNKITKPTRIKEISHDWQLVDASGRALGRIATVIANKLMGKSKPYFVHSLDCGDFVVVINAALIRLTGKKLMEKTYSSYSGYPGGMKKKAAWQVKQEKPNELVRHAVWGMLPKNKLRHRLITRLYIYPDVNHPYMSKIKGGVK
jgi:large subunit ribosomal protein L13